MPDQSVAKSRAQVTDKSALRRQPSAGAVVIAAMRSMRNAATRWNSRHQACLTLGRENRDLGRMGTP
jgi:hypothetical protein